MPSAFLLQHKARWRIGLEPENQLAVGDFHRVAGLFPAQADGGGGGEFRLGGETDGEFAGDPVLFPNAEQGSLAIRVLTKGGDQGSRPRDAQAGLFNRQLAGGAVGAGGKQRQAGFPGGDGELGGRPEAGVRPDPSVVTVRILLRCRYGEEPARHSHQLFYRSLKYRGRPD